MNLIKLCDDLKADEGCVNEIYICPAGHPTFGIGHMITKKDAEHGEPVGTAVSDERVQEAFEADITITLADCEKLYPDFDELPEEVQLIIANMLFNMGLPRLSSSIAQHCRKASRSWTRARCTRDFMPDSLIPASAASVRWVSPSRSTRRRSSADSAGSSSSAARAQRGPDGPRAEAGGAAPGLSLGGGGRRGGEGEKQETTHR